MKNFSRVKKTRPKEFATGAYCAAAKQLIKRYINKNAFNKMGDDISERMVIEGQSQKDYFETIDKIHDTGPNACATVDWA